MKWKCTFTLLLVISLTFASIEFTFQPLKAQGEESSVDTPYVICKKTELMEIRYAPTGDLLEKSVSVHIEIYNNGSSPVSLKVIDRVASINSSTLTVLYGTPEPTKTLKNFGNLTKLIWENVTVDGGKTVRYRYTAESLRKIPIEVNTTLLVNGKPAYINESSGIYSVNANLSDTIGFQLKIKNVQQPLYTSYNRTAVQPLLCTTSLALSNDYFSGIRTSPKANSTTALAGKTVMTWITFLGNETQTLNASASVTGVGAWGAVTLDPITIQISSSETLKSYFENMISSLNYTIELMEGFAASSGELSTQTSEMAQALEEIANVTSELGNTTALVQTLWGIGKALNVTDQTLELAQNCILLANASLTAFINTPETQDFLSNNSDLGVYLYSVMANISTAYWLINMTRYGNKTIPGLVQLSAMAYKAAQAVNSTGTVLRENVTDSLREIEGGLFAIAISATQTKIGLEQSLSDLKSERTTLTDVLLTLDSEAILPFDPEIKHIETGNCTLTPTVKKIDNKWSITAVNVTNPANYSKIVYGVKLKLETSESLNPSVEVIVDRSWQTPKDMEWLGITYNSTSKTFYLLPRIKIEPNSTVNVLVDWLGRPLRIILDCEEKPVTVDVDTADLQEGIEVEAVEAQFSCSIVQPQLIMNFTAPPPPPVANVTQAKSLAEILMEYLQKPEAQIAVLLVIAVIAVVAGVSKKRKMERTKRLSAEKGEIETLLKEIDEAKKILEEENPPD